MMRAVLTVLSSVLLAATGAFAAGPYLGQEPPGDEPRIFAPGIVSTGLHERDLLALDEGRTLWFGVMTGTATTVLETRLEDGAWTPPVAVPFHTDPDYVCFEPSLAPGGDLVLFLSNRAAPGQEQGTGWANQNLFFSRRAPGGWSAPAAVPPPVTTDRAEYFPSIAADGTLYFSREDADGHPAIYAAEPTAAGAPNFADPVRLPATVNVAADCYNATVAPDESWIILCVAGHPENLGRSDYWISFRAPDGTWQPAVNMGDRFNGPGLRAASASLSHDGKQLFFSTNRGRDDAPFPSGRVTGERLQALHTEAGNGSYDIWWVDASVLEDFRAKP
jgi:hypothetical protein